ncbi:4-hydroxy-tetrahydrodipicolinate synthase [Clostridium sp.]|uniref:4-hydroxy-tetrahydrodipicolinate synthase n=1 Tax=Clostridium sp. TaxID=1506 RepID=UPI001A509FC8|nr:4-hydroxy-tetrahydrodipicolinate synthase [Clostridium sp.]MBK5242944.1 4-hydroxy-tetrahydrodipicolinate synthase [Clostridium sp.]
MTKREKFGKILIPMITPYKKNEEVNYETYAKLVEYLISHKCCDSLIVTGTTGEASLLTFAERVKLMKVAFETAEGRVPVIAGVGCASTCETIALTKEAEEIGYDTVMVVVPFYNKPTQEGVYQHFKKVAESTSCDVILYNIPIFVGINLEPETVGRLASIKNIIGVKDEAGINPTQITDFFLITKDIDPDFLVYNGDDIMLLPTIIQGAMGVVSGNAHIFGDEIRAIFDSYQKGNPDEAKKHFIPMYRVCKAAGQNGRILPNPIMRHAISMITGIDLGESRLPLVPPTKEELEVMKLELRKAGKI